MNSSLIKDFLKEIYINRKRFISIVLIVVLGVGFFSGIKCTTPSMKYTASKYFEDSNFMDFSLKSTLGFTNKSINILKNNIEEVDNIYPSYSKDMLININDSENVIKVSSIDNDVNKLELVEGNLPNKPDEILVDNKLEVDIGDSINIENDDFLSCNSLKIVGKVNSPLYISIERGNSQVGNGKISGFMYVDKSIINSKVYTDLYITLKNRNEFLTYSSEYSNYISIVNDKLDKLLPELNDNMYNTAIDFYTNYMLNNYHKTPSQTEIDNIIQYPTTYIFTRDDNIGYSEYKNNSEKIDAIR